MRSETKWRGKKSGCDHALRNLVYVRCHCPWQEVAQPDGLWGPCLPKPRWLCQLLEFSCGVQEKSFLLQKQCHSSGQGCSGDGSSLPLLWFLSWAVLPGLLKDGTAAGLSGHHSTQTASTENCLWSPIHLWPALIKSPTFCVQSKMLFLSVGLKVIMGLLFVPLVTGGNLLMKLPPQTRTYQFPCFQQWIWWPFARTELNKNSIMS